MSDFNVIVIGAGPGGYVCAIECAHRGLKTAVIEKHDVGGTCLNRGCIPTKALLHSAEIFHSLKTAEKYGITVGESSFDFAKVHEKKAEVVTKLRTGVESLFKANGIELIRGEGVIVDKNTVKVGENSYTADNIVIATGSVPAMPPIPGLDGEGVITSDDMLDGTPEFENSIIIIGGGVIGVEFASVYASFGAQVTIIEAMDRILPTMDKEISQNLAMILKKKGVKINTSAKVSEVTTNEDGTKCCKFEMKGKPGEASANRVLVAIGRRPNMGNLLSEGFSLETERGRIITNENYETSVPGVYAIGDVTSRIQLAHTASCQGVFVANKIAGGESHTNLELIPSCIYTSPEIAAVGMTEDEAVKAGYTVRIGKFMMHANGKTIIADGERGFIKIVADAETGKVLGGQLMCERATDMLSEITTAVANGLTVDDMLKVMRPHPTFNEGVSEAFESVFGTSIHTAPKKRL